jgi:hypothetical protein
LLTSRKRIVDGEVEAHLIVLRCSEPPEGRNKWNLRLLADKLVELEIVPDISHETVRPYDPNRPVVCMDETSKQLIADIRIPIAAKPGHP